MGRLLRVVFWFALLGALLYFFREPLQRAGTVVQLMRQDLPDTLPVPVEGVPASRLHDTWGASRSGGRVHEGIDIFARCGTPVLSTTRGVVFNVGENRLGGLMVRVMGPGSSWHYYAHLSRHAEIQTGDEVQSGDTLGYVGRTGNARGTPCHLHYGLYLDGKARNPYPLLTQP